MDELAKAFTSPAWWVLTVVVGLLLNVTAPFINRGIEKWWAARSGAKGRELQAEKATIENKAERLATTPTGLLEAKLEVIYWGLRILVLVSGTILSVQLIFALPFEHAKLFAGPAALIGFVGFSGYWKKWEVAHRVHNRVLDELRPSRAGEA